MNRQQVFESARGHLVKFWPAFTIPNIFWMTWFLLVPAAAQVASTWSFGHLLASFCPNYWTIPNIFWTTWFLPVPAAAQVASIWNGLFSDQYNPRLSSGFCCGWRSCWALSTGSVRTSLAPSRRRPWPRRRPRRQSGASGSALMTSLPTNGGTSATAAGGWGGWPGGWRTPHPSWPATAQQSSPSGCPAACCSTCSGALSSRTQAATCSCVFLSGKDRNEKSGWSKRRSGVQSLTSFYGWWRVPSRASFLNHRAVADVVHGPSPDCSFD